ncbi:MAG: hypothetical protein AAGB25_07375 [Pseudomonadota bacterium]
MRRAIGLVLLPTGIILGGYATKRVLDAGQMDLSGAIVSGLAIAMILVGARYVFAKAS